MLYLWYEIVALLSSQLNLCLTYTFCHSTGIFSTLQGRTSLYWERLHGNIQQRKCGIVRIALQTHCITPGPSVNKRLVNSMCICSNSAPYFPLVHLVKTFQLHCNFYSRFISPSWLSVAHICFLVSRFPVKEQQCGAELRDTTQSVEETCI